uniref:hypothetical protein n=1 Tax=Timspurckia oligopyrenoides TaxID=708627 RepID=UPI001FCDCA89|nr:hypothetical protein MW591_pgp037 [Timspurckia oligopyrenoides]UNJ17578.1 hypothetical protein [Timspurckia oligopyrenoides]
MHYLYSDPLELPTLKQYVSRIVNLKSISETWIFDCAEGITQRTFCDLLVIDQISSILISNFKSSYITGLIGFLATLNLSGRTKPISIYAPKHTKEYLFYLLKYSQTNFSFHINLNIIDCHIKYSNEKICFFNLKADNTFYEFAYKIISRQVPGKLQTQIAYAHGVLPSFIYQELKNHKDFFLLDGTTVKGHTCCAIPTLGDKTILLSSRPNRRILLEIVDSKQHQRYKVMITITVYRWCCLESTYS